MVTAKHITLFLVVGLLCAMSARSQQEYIVNRQFDSDTVGWSHESFSGSGSMEWDGAIGSPNPGSLKLNATGPVAGQYAVSDACFPAAEGTTWTLSAQAREEPGSDPATICSVVIRVYTTTDCSIPSYTSIDGNPALFNDWTYVEASVQNLFGSPVGMKPVLLNSVSTAASGVCHFDDVSLIGPAPATIPALGPFGLGLLVVVLVLAGTVILRKTAL